jgi:ABC-2 type transport system permease protein
VVFAKYLASLSLVALMLVLSGAYAITLGILGQPDWGPIYSGYLGLFLLGAALVAVGLMTSSLVSNQIILGESWSLPSEHTSWRFEYRRRFE